MSCPKKQSLIGMAYASVVKFLMDGFHVVISLRKKMNHLIQAKTVGWKLNNGSQEKAIYISQCNGTSIPNLTDSYIVQAGGTYDLGEAGGSNMIALKTENIPPHKHNIDIGGSSYKHDHANSGVIRLQSGFSTLTDSTIYDNSGNVVTEGAKSAKSFDNRPKSFALYKLIKVI